MTEASRHDMHRHTGKQQSRGVKVPQIMQPCPGQYLTDTAFSRGRVVCLNQVSHQ